MAPQKALGLENHTEDTNGNWTINNAQGVVELREEVNGGNDFSGKTVTLAADIDLSSVCNESTPWTPIGNGSYETSYEPCFCGTFDGANHTISKLHINSQTDCQGLFGAIKNAIIKNLALGEVTSPEIGDKGILGGICAKAFSCSFEHCAAYNVTIYGNDCIGGFCGSCTDSSFSNCIAYNINIISVMGISGGICGYTYGNSSMKNCYAKVFNRNSNFSSNPVETYENNYYDMEASNIKDEATGEGLSSAEFLQKLKDVYNSNPVLLAFLKDEFPKTPKSSDFVFSHPKDMAYDGKGKVITIEPKPGITGMGVVTVKYYKVDETQLDGPPTDAGRYKIKFDVAAGTEYGAATDLPAMF